MTARFVLLSAVLLSAVLAWAAGGIPPTQDPRAQDKRPDYSSGAYLYRTFCASCHGETGRGDGPVADLSVPRAPDITALQRSAGGTFPRARVLGVLDGSIRLEGHDGGAMPNWSQVLRRTEGDDDRVVRKRLEALVSHVESLQVR